MWVSKFSMSKNRAIFAITLIKSPETPAKTYNIMTTTIFFGFYLYTLSRNWSLVCPKSSLYSPKLLSLQTTNEVAMGPQYVRLLAPVFRASYLFIYFQESLT